MMNAIPDEKTEVLREKTAGVSRDDRQQMLLDDLRVEVARLADAVERQNKLLADSDPEVADR